MKVLALDTSSLMSTCAIIEDGNLLGEYSLSRDMSHSERLIPMIEEMMEELKLDIEDIDLYGVSTGPGSFTGLRIGVASVKAFAHVFKKPIVGVSTLEGLAYNLAYNDIVVPIMDARRDRVYTGIYTWEGDKLKTISPPDVIHIDDLLDILSEYKDIVMNGDGVYVFKDRILDRLGEKVRFSKIGNNDCSAASIGHLALDKFNRNEVDDYYNLIPDYLRVSQAEREKNKGK